MSNEGIITRITEPTPWVNSMVVVQKKDKIRIVIDPRDLNKAIKREHYPMKTVEEVATRLAGAAFFSVLDVEKAFWHVKLDSKSAKLTTFNSPLHSIIPLFHNAVYTLSDQWCINKVIYVIHAVVPMITELCAVEIVSR